MSTHFAVAMISKTACTLAPTDHLPPWMTIYKRLTNINLQKIASLDKLTMTCQEENKVSSSIISFILLVNDSTVQNVLISPVGLHTPAIPPLSIKNYFSTILYPSVPLFISIYINQMESSLASELLLCHRSLSTFASDLGISLSRKSA